MIILSEMCSAEMSLSRAEQSSDYSAFTTAYRAIDKDNNTRSKTADEYNPWWRSYFDWHFKVISLSLLQIFFKTVSLKTKSPKVHHILNL